jgi:predicted 3-demethylubiquinone-9 3-methyltransferase (glyoxalase superfamily)
MAIISTQKITPFLWFESRGAEGAEYYTTIFPDSAIVSKAPMVTIFTLCNQQFAILEAGPHDQFNDSVSFYVDCQNQEEVDYYWDRFINDGGEESMCGWLQDKFGVRWQIIPRALITLMGDPDPQKSKRVMEAMLKMTRIIVADLENAYNK